MRQNTKPHRIACCVLLHKTTSAVISKMLTSFSSFVRMAQALEAIFFIAMGFYFAFSEIGIVHYVLNTCVE